MVEITLRVDQDNEPTIWVKLQGQEEGMNLLAARIVHNELGRRIRQAEGVAEALEQADRDEEEERQAPTRH